MKIPFLPPVVCLTCLTALLVPRPAVAGIISVEETGLAADGPAVIGEDFGEDVLVYADRDHQHNGAAFDSSTGLLNITGDIVVPLPEYLAGNSYVMFDNDARDNAGYSATITADELSIFYLLVDNRVNGLTVPTLKTNTTDPVLGGALQWIVDGGWERVNTGISPDGLPDYTGVDENGDGFGPGDELQNFMAVFRFPVPATQVVVRNNGVTGTNNIAVVAAPAPPSVDPVASFIAQPETIAPGESALLTWAIDPTFTAATIDNGVGNVAPLTGTVGDGSASVSPLVSTTYTLSVTTPGGSGSATATVDVRPLATVSISPKRVGAGESATLSWRVRPDAAVSIEGIGAVTTGPDGFGSLTVQPEETRDYVVSAVAGGVTQAASAGVVVFPAGQTFALLDIGATGGRVEPGSANGRQIGAAAHNTNGVDLEVTEVVADDGSVFEVAIDCLDADGFPVGGLDWRDRGDGPVQPLVRMGEDFVKNNAGVVRVTFGGLPEGVFDVLSWHIDSDNSQSSGMQVIVSDADGTNVDTGVVADASYPDHPANTGAPGIAGLTTAIVFEHESKFRIRSNGTDDVVVLFDASFDGTDTEATLSGMWLIRQNPPVVPPEGELFALIDIGGVGGRPEPGSAGGIVVGEATDTPGVDLLETPLTGAGGAPFAIAIDSLDPEEFPVGGLDWRDRGDGEDEFPLVRLAEDLVKNNAGMIRVTLTGLPAGEFDVTSYHLDPDFSQCEEISILVTDSAGTAVKVATGSAAFAAGDAGAPGAGALYPGIVIAKGTTFPVRTDGASPVILYFDGTAAIDTEVPLAALRIISRTGLPPVPQPVRVVSVRRTIDAGSAAVALEFRSTPGSTYRIEAGNDLASWPDVLAASHPAAATGETTTFTEPGIPLTTGRRFYRVTEN